MSKLPMYMPVLKAAQYLANISIEQDFKSELGNAVFSFFDVDVVAVAEKSPEGEIVLYDRWKDGNMGLSQKMVVDNVLDVLDTALVKTEEIPEPANMTLIFVPIEVKKQAVAALIIGHYKINSAEIKNLLNEYLAVARLAGSIQTRIVYERENIQRKSDEKFRLLFDSSHDPILLLNKTGCIIECNDATIQMLGAEYKEQLLMRPISYFSPEYQPDGQDSAAKEEYFLHKVTETGNAQFEWVVQRTDGTEFIVDTKLTTILLDGKKVQLVHWRDITGRKQIEKQLQYLNAELESRVIARTRELQDMNAVLEEEISERHATEEALRQLNAELEHKVLERTAALSDMNAVLEEEIAGHQEANEALLHSRDVLAAREVQLKHYAAELTETNKELKSFANIVAHDFRAPMVNLKGFSQELGYSLDDLKQIINDELARLPEAAQKNLDNLLNRDVPEALKIIQSSVDRLDRMVTALLGLARMGRREMIYQEVDMHGLVNTVLQSVYHQIEQKNIHIEVEPLPTIKTDLLAMEQIVGNLLDNAIKFLNPDRPGKISISCTANDDEYVLSVQDNGRGIAAADMDKIFEIFRRAGAQDVPGEGMGLAYVRTLIRQLNGKVWCESELGIGTKMNFTVPKYPYEG